MKTRLILKGLAIVIFFSSCSKEANFTNSATSYGGYHKAVQIAAQTITQPEEINLSASTEDQPVITNQTLAFPAYKVVQAENNKPESATVVATTLSKKNVKTITKEIRKEAKKTTDATAKDKSQLVAALLCCLCLVGVHRFYLGYTTIGIIQLSLALLAVISLIYLIIIPFLALIIWILIDFIRILTGSLKPKNGEYKQTI